MIIWLTGQPGAGKTTIADELLGPLGLETAHRNPYGGPPIRIDGDIFRNVMLPFPEGIDPDGENARSVNVDRAQSLARYLQHVNNTVIVSLVSPFREQREWLKVHSQVLEVYVHTTEMRGREHLFYNKYELPLTNFLDLDTGELSIDECVKKILSVHRKRATVLLG